jgi:hypothetical protein
VSGAKADYHAQVLRNINTGAVRVRFARYYSYRRVAGIMTHLRDEIASVPVPSWEDGRRLAAEINRCLRRALAAGGARSR